jgi:hypothetical protein
MMAQVWAENCLTYFSFVTYSYVPEHWNRMIPEPSGTILNWSSPLTSGTIGTVGFAASLGPCQPRLTTDLDPVWMGHHPIQIHFEWETIPFQGYHLFSTQIPVAVWQLLSCVVRSLRMYSSEPRPSYRPTHGDGLEDWSMNGFWFRQGT